MNIGIIKETKTPPDRRVPLTPDQCNELQQKYPGLQILVEPDSKRCYSDDEYASKGIGLSTDLSECEILMGVKEVKISSLQDNKTYLFFSHTAKKQAHNRDLLKAVLQKKIRLIDYEYLTNPKKERVVAFGRWAGIVGTYNGLLTYGRRYNSFRLKPAWQCKDLNEMLTELKQVRPGKSKILVTGGGRVAKGALEILKKTGIKEVSPEEFINKEPEEAVFSRIDPWHYAKHKEGREFQLKHFFDFPQEYESVFYPYTKKTDLLVSCHYWDPRSPVLMTKEDMKKEDFRIRVIADVTCDIEGSIPSTLRASEISDPVYGYNPLTEREDNPWNMNNVSVMAVDNLPGELPRDASADFGNKLSKEVIPFLIGKKKGNIISGATITEDGELTSEYSYLNDYVLDKE